MKKGWFQWWSGVGVHESFAFGKLGITIIWYIPNWEFGKCDGYRLGSKGIALGPILIDWCP